MYVCDALYGVFKYDMKTGKLILVMNIIKTVMKLNVYFIDDVTANKEKNISY